jgi:hypothetical protein
VKLSALVDDYAEARSVGLMLTEPELTDCAVRATRFYAGYGKITSLDEADNQPAAGEQPSDPPAVLGEAYPVKDLGSIDAEVDLTVGEWAVISPLFYLYVELLNATRLEASRASGIEPFGRSSSEIQQEITLMETETLPQRSFSQVVVTI